MTISEIIAKRLDLRQQQVENTMELLEGGATIPFISRYRKEATGGLNEVQVTQINDLNTQLGELVHRREYILETIEAQGKLTDALRQNAGMPRFWKTSTCPSSLSAKRGRKRRDRRDSNRWHNSSCSRRTSIR